MGHAGPWNCPLREGHQQAKQAAARAVPEAKTPVWEFGEAMGKKIGQPRKTSSKACGCVDSAGGDLLI